MCVVPAPFAVAPLLCPHPYPSILPPPTPPHLHSVRPPLSLCLSHLPSYLIPLPLHLQPVRRPCSLCIRIRGLTPSRSPPPVRASSFAVRIRNLTPSRSLSA